jgi:hypothetical protein
MDLVNDLVTKAKKSAHEYAQKQIEIKRILAAQNVRTRISCINDPQSILMPRITSTPYLTSLERSLSDLQPIGLTSAAVATVAANLEEMLIAANTKGSSPPIDSHQQPQQQQAHQGTQHSYLALMCPCGNDQNSEFSRATSKFRVIPLASFASFTSPLLLSRDFDTFDTQTCRE